MKYHILLINLITFTLASTPFYYGFSFSNGYDNNVLANVTVCAKNPGSWANGLRVGILDSKADQTLTVSSLTNISVGYGVTQAVPAGTVPIISFV